MILTSFLFFVFVVLLFSTEYAQQYPCPAGTYLPTTGSVDASACLSCPSGAYCPQGSAAPTLCPAGTYNNNTRVGFVQFFTSSPSLVYYFHRFLLVRRILEFQSPKHNVFSSPNVLLFSFCVILSLLQGCMLCPAGMSCPSSGLNGLAALSPCVSGYFCPQGTSYALANPCPPGSYGNLTNSVRAEECTICPAGLFIFESDSHELFFTCAFFRGYSSVASLRFHNFQMYIIGVMFMIAGFACAPGSNFANKPPLSCAAGYFCPAGTATPTQRACAAGRYRYGSRFLNP